VLAYMLLNAITKENMLHQLAKESPLVGPHTSTKPANGRPLTSDRGHGCSESLSYVDRVE